MKRAMSAQPSKSMMVMVMIVVTMMTYIDTARFSREKNMWCEKVGERGNWLVELFGGVDCNFFLLFFVFFSVCWAKITGVTMTDLRPPKLSLLLLLMTNDDMVSLSYRYRTTNVSLSCYSLVVMLCCRVALLFSAALLFHTGCCYGVLLLGILPLRSK